jgi:membrane protease YdiL (CAAX protease family)
MQGVQEWVGENPETAIPLAILVVVLFAPAVEEIIFRGAIFGGLRKLAALLFRRLRRYSKGPGTIGVSVSFVFAAPVSSALFALLHLEPVLLPTLFMLAIALCALYQRTGNLLPCFVAHATFNSFAVLIIILSGLGALPVQV